MSLEMITLDGSAFFKKYIDDCTKDLFFTKEEALNKLYYYIGFYVVGGYDFATNFSILC